MNFTVINDTYDGIKDGVERYTNQIPNDMTNNAVSSAVISFVITGFFSSAPTLASCTACGAVAALATVIDGVLSPVFQKYLLNEQGKYDWTVKTVKNIASIALASSLVIGVGFNSEFILGAALVYAVVNFLFRGDDGYLANKTSLYFSPLWV